ncbi:MAG TPA: methyltransferase domain-containing protein [Burkholderiales bacterium]|nr:methyltransferase domain-containing protein [Burkholderiales bacterium]
MELRHRLLRRLLAENPFQPATSWWRAIELAVVVRHGLPRGRGVDLGCGDGKLMRILLEAAGVAPELVGVDLDPLETRQAERAGVYRRVHTAPGDRIPEPERAFDFVFSNSVLEHIPDLAPVLAEVQRLLRPGGVFLFTVPSAGFHDCLAGPLFGDRTAYLRLIDSRCAHVRYWDEREWRAALERHGMSVTHAEPYLSAGEVRRWETLSRFTAGVLYTMSGRRAQPIEIQRALGLRARGLRLPAWMAAALADALSANVAPEGDGRFGCLLVEARRP